MVFIEALLTGIIQVPLRAQSSNRDNTKLKVTFLVTKETVKKSQHSNHIQDNQEQRREEPYLRTMIENRLTFFKSNGSAPSFSFPR